ncbi:MAG: peptidoglycan bridge formation glycyltransferase FemA/FemB family protein [Gemmatimonadetes bacterium]|nr:peptidoglycan bridge formation glycyltransferase FemA/FemB family protein [Gemmatimonadota bacterium]
MIGAPHDDSHREPFAGISLDRTAADPEWDQFLASAGGHYHVQSSLWARIKRLNGWEAFRIKIRDRKGIVGGAQILSRSVGLFGKVGYVAQGPVIGAGDKELANVILAAVVDSVVREDLRVLILQAPAYGAVTRSLKAHGFQAFDVEVSPSATAVVDLRPELDDILGRMSKGMRNGVRRSQRRGISTRTGTRADVPIFHRLLEATSQRRGISIYPVDYFLGLWDVLEPAGAAAIFLSEWNGEPVSAQLCILFGNTIVAKRIGWSGKHGKLHPNEALDWHTIRWAKERGLRYYDLEGIERGAARSLIDTGSLPPQYRDTPTSYKVRLGGEPRLHPPAACYFANSAMGILYKLLGTRILAWDGAQRAIARFRTGSTRSS